MFDILFTMPPHTNYESLLMLIVSVLVQVPEAVKVKTTPVDGTQSIRLSVDPADKGHVIGTDGHTIRAIRTILVAAAHRDQAKVALEVV